MLLDFLQLENHFHHLSHPRLHWHRCQLPPFQLPVLCPNSCFWPFSLLSKGHYPQRCTKNKTFHWQYHNPVHKVLLVMQAITLETKCIMYWNNIINHYPMIHGPTLRYHNVSSNIQSSVHRLSRSLEPKNVWKPKCTLYETTSSRGSQ